MCYEKSTYLVRRSGKNDKEKEMPSFSSSSFDAATTVTETETEVKTVGAAKGPVKDGSKEEAADGRAGASGLFDAPAAQQMEKIE